MSQHALDRYDDAFNPGKYAALQEAIADALHRAFDDPLPRAAMHHVTSTALQLCGHTTYEGAHLELSIFCQAYHLPLSLIDQIHHHLQEFTTGCDIRLEDFHAIAKALHIATHAFEELRTSNTLASAIHSGQGRCAHHLLVAAEHLTLAARHLLMGKHDAYVKEKLALAEERVTMAQQEDSTNH